MVDFGLGLLAGPPKGQNERFLSDLDATLAQLKGSFRSIWMTDHFFWDGEPTYEAWTVLSYLAARYPDFEVGPMVLGQSYRNPGSVGADGGHAAESVRGPLRHGHRRRLERRRIPRLWLPLPRAESPCAAVGRDADHLEEDVGGARKAQLSKASTTVSPMPGASPSPSAPFPSWWAAAAIPP